jgi:flavin-dependent dehydrogenase
MSTPPASPPESTYDVAVAGGGPAGAAVATFLARQGHRCIVFEPSKFPRYHIGESLIPHTYGILDRLGVLPKLRASAFPEKRSVRFVAHDGRESAPFYFSETISGEGAVTWQVERGEFDRLLLDHARASGVEVCAQRFVRSVLFENGRAVGVLATDETGAGGEVHARVVVDATGRVCLIGNQLGLRDDVPDLHKAALWGYFRHGLRLPGIDAGETTIFHTHAGGWFWYIPLPEDIVSVGLVGAPEYLFAQQFTKDELLTAEIAKCPALAARLARAERDGPVRALGRLAYLNRQTCGDGWVMLGDARAFLDPIYSSGIYLALASAEMAAPCIHEALVTGDVSAARLGKFEPALWQGVDVIRRLIHAFYDPRFSFTKFARRFPEHRAALIDCLVGNVLKDMRPFAEALSQMTPPPASLLAAA